MENYPSISRFLPTSAKEMRALGWEQADVILFSGDAYIDHPAFGSAVIGRVLHNLGLRIAIVPQPNWRDDLRDFKKMGIPRLFFGVTAGNMDSMINHYTANKRLRSDDAYSPSGKAGHRPDYASVVYTHILKDIYPDIPVVLGGIEASLRRLTHYDYWSDSLKPGILAWSGADLLVYGMGEKSLAELVKLLQRGVPFDRLNTIPQTAVLINREEPLPKNKQWEDRELHAHAQCVNDKKSLALNFRHIEQESNLMHAARLHQVYGEKRIVVNPPWPPGNSKELDLTFDLPYTREPHPRYRNKGPIPAFEMIKNSVTLHRGCFGGCSFCTISAHQGKFVVSRSKESILKEVNEIAKSPGFKGYLSDLGGPSANMYQMQGKDLSICEKCKRPSCIFPSVCANLETSHEPLLGIYRATDKIPGIKKSFIGSGVRYDLLLNPKASEAEKKSHMSYAKELITKHVSGRLKVAPEHTSEKVLKVMRKPSFSLFKEFVKLFNQVNQEHKLNQQIIPYFISSHPGCSEADMARLAVETKELSFNLEQVQDFTPTPMTLATVMYYTGLDPYTLQKVETAHTRQEKQNQRQFFFWHQSKMRASIIKRLEQLGLIDIKNQLFDTNLHSGRKRDHKPMPAREPSPGKTSKNNISKNKKR